MPELSDYVPVHLEICSCGSVHVLRATMDRLVEPPSGIGRAASRACPACGAAPHLLCWDLRSPAASGFEPHYVHESRLGAGCPCCGSYDTVGAIDNDGQPYVGCAHCKIVRG